MRQSFFPRILIVLSIFIGGFASGAEQRLTLDEGWNAVFVALEPDDPAPDKLFGSLPILKVALWLPSKAKVESLTDPAAVPNKPSEWLIWHPANHPAAFLNTLKQVQGRRAMLIKASAPATLVIKGTPFFRRTAWVAPSFNLVGFDIDPAAPPTFARFFDGSRAHEELKIFRLVDGAWKSVSGFELMRRGEAYWVWCKEGSDFQGPVDLSISIGETVRMEARSNGVLPVSLSSNVNGLGPVSMIAGKRYRFALSPAEMNQGLNLSGGGMRFEIPAPAGN